MTDSSGRARRDAIRAEYVSEEAEEAEAAAAEAVGAGQQAVVTARVPASSADALKGRAAPGEQGDRPSSNLTSAGFMRVTVSVDSLDGEPPSKDTFAWTVLNTLAGEVGSSTGPGQRVAIELTKRCGD